MIIIPESAGTVSVCVSTNVTLNGTRTASAVMQTQDVTAQGQSSFCSVYHRVHVTSGSHSRLYQEIVIMLTAGHDITGNTIPNTLDNVTMGA